MNISVITFPGSNCDRDVITAAAEITGKQPTAVWHKDTDLGNPDLVIIPGGWIEVITSPVAGLVIGIASPRPFRKLPLIKAADGGVMLAAMAV